MFVPGAGGPLLGVTDPGSDGVKSRDDILHSASRYPCTEMVSKRDGELRGCAAASRCALCIL